MALDYIPSDRPCYRILAIHGFFGPNDHLYREGDIIVYEGTPNEEMEPLNEPARLALRKYIEGLDELDKAQAEKLGKAWIRRPRNLDEALAQATAYARQVQTVQGGPGVPVMGARKGDMGVELVTDLSTPETGAPTLEPLRNAPHSRKRAPIQTVDARR